MSNKIQAHLRSMAASILCAVALVAMAAVAAAAASVVVEHTFVVSLHACMFGSNFSERLSSENWAQP